MIHCVEIILIRFSYIFTQDDAGSSVGSLTNLNNMLDVDNDVDNDVDDVSTSTIKSLTRKLTSSGDMTSRKSHLRTSGSSSSRLKSSSKAPGNGDFDSLQPDRTVLLNKYSRSQSSIGMDTQPYQIHGRMMGWKLTTRNRRKKLFNIINKVRLKEEEGFLFDTERLKAKKKELERVSLRSADACEKNLRRMIDARSRNPKHTVSHQCTIILLCQI